MKREIRPYQDDALAGVVRMLEQGMNRGMWKMPTGTGKTFTFAQLLKRLDPWLAQFKTSDRLMLVIAHREELLDQAAATIAAENPGLTVMVEQGDRHASPWADVIVASIQTLSAQKFVRLRRLLTMRTPRVVVVDECHHAAASTYRTALALLGFLPMADASDVENFEAATHDDVEVMTKALTGWDQQAPKDRVLLGVTATPNRSDAVGLGCVFQTICYSYDLKAAIADGWLVPIKAWSVETRTSLDGVKIQRGDFNQRQLADTVNNPQRNELALAAWNEHGDGGSTIGFTVDVEHAHDMKEVFERAGVRADAVSGETPKEDRQRILRQFSEGQIDVVFNCMVLTEGTDLPRTSNILQLRPTKSASLLEQMIGRGLRLFPNKTHCTVIDLVDTAGRHNLQTAPVLYGLPPGLMVKGKKLEAVEDEFERLREDFPRIDAEFDGRHLTLEQLNALAKQIDVFYQPDLGDFAVGRKVQWAHPTPDRYRVSYPWADGNEEVAVVKTLLDTWDVVLIERSRLGGAHAQRTLATNLPAAVVGAEIAEAFITNDRRSVLKLKGCDAPWMRNPASSKQIALLKKLGVTQIPKGMTAGQASQAIDNAKHLKARMA